MSTAFPTMHRLMHGKSLANWPKSWGGTLPEWRATLPETSVYAMLFLWIGTQHDFTVASVIAAVLAVFCLFLPR